MWAFALRFHLPPAASNTLLGADVEIPVQLPGEIKGAAFHLGRIQNGHHVVFNSHQQTFPRLLPSPGAYRRPPAVPPWPAHARAGAHHADVAVADRRA